MAFESIRAWRGFAFSTRSETRRGRSGAKRLRPGGRGMLEALEARLALTTFYVDYQLQLTADRDQNGGFLSAGDQVTFGSGQSYQQTHLTYDAAAADGDAGTAFSSLTQALASPLVQSGDTIDVAGGFYSDGAVINKSITIQGFGAVVLSEVTIDNNPASVTLADLKVWGALLANGVGALTLSDVTQSRPYGSYQPTDPGQLPYPPGVAHPLWAPDSLLTPPFTFPPPQSRISNVATLNLIRTGSESENVVIGPGSVQLNQFSLPLENVANLSITTGNGADTFGVSPAPMNVTIDGGDPAPPTQPGDTLYMSFTSDPGNSLSVSKDSTGYSGVWNFSGGGQLHFSHFEMLSPGVIVHGEQSINATVGSDSGSVTVAKFTDPLGNLPMWNYSAEIDWPDGTKTAGAITFDSNTGLFAVSGDHVFGKPNGNQVRIIIHRTDSPDMIAIATAVVADAPSGLSPDQQFVSKLYGDLLHRLADAAGLDYWSGRLAAGLSRLQLALDLEDTAEYRQGQVGSLYQHYLHRNADPAALQNMGALLAAGTSDEALAATIVGSDEYFKLHGGTNDGFLNGLFLDALGRPIDPGAKTALEQALAQGASRLQIAQLALGSHEYHALIVENIYAELLNRSADTAGDAYWADALDRGLTDEQLLASVVESQEYFNG